MDYPHRSFTTAVKMYFSDMPYSSETEMCQAVRTALGKFGTVYPEIMGCDYVIDSGSQIIAVEAKMTLNLKVFEQAFLHLELGEADQSYILVPRLNTHSETMFKICRRFGVGILIASNHEIFESVCADTFPRTSNRLQNLLHPQALTHTDAGKAGCKSWTHGKLLECKYVDYLTAYLEENPWDTDGGVQLEHAIYDVEPEARGKKVKVRQTYIDRTAHYILSGYWTKVRLENAKLYLTNPV